MTFLEDNFKFLKVAGEKSTLDFFSSHGQYECLTTLYCVINMCMFYSFLDDDEKKHSTPLYCNEPAASKALLFGSGYGPQ